MNRITNKYLNQVKKEIRNSYRTELETKLRFIETIKNSNEIKDIINWSRHVGSRLNVVLTLLPDLYISDDSIFEEEKEPILIFDSKKNKGRYDKGLDFYLDLESKIIYVPHVSVTTMHYSLSYALHSSGLLKETEEDKKELDPIYLDSFLKKYKLKREDFVNQVSSNLLNVFKETKSDKVLLLETLDKLKLPHDDYITNILLKVESLYKQTLSSTGE